MTIRNGECKKSSDFGRKRLSPPWSTPLEHAELEVMMVPSSGEAQQAGPGTQRSGQSEGCSRQGKGFSSSVSKL